MNDMPPPIVVFAFNRPAHLQATLAALQDNVGARNHELYVFCDGPRNSSDAEAVAAVRQIAESVSGFRSVRRFFSAVNRGLANSIIDGLTRVFETNWAAMVFEDDIVSHPQTVEYLSAALARYENYPSVFSVSAYCIARQRLRVPLDYPYNTFFARRGSSWGWATWKRAWQLARWDMDYFEGIERSRARRRAFQRGGSDLWNMLRAQKRGELDSWAIRFQYSMFRHGGVCLFPLDSLVENIGYGPSATHTRHQGRHKTDVASAPRTFQFPEEVFIAERLADSYASVGNARVVGFLKEALRRLRKGRAMGSRTAQTSARD